MADSFTQIYIQVVFATKGRQALLHKSYREKVFAYIGGILRNQGQIPLAINGVVDHVHIFFIYRPHTPLSDLVRDIKRDSSAFINKNNFTRQLFRWQPSYGGFSYGSSQVEHIIKYVENQEEHHRKKAFSEEIREFLRKYKAPDNIYDWIE